MLPPIGEIGAAPADVEADVAFPTSVSPILRAQPTPQGGTAAADGTATPSSLAFTGSGDGTAVLVALGLLSLGLILLGAVRPRSTR